MSSIDDRIGPVNSVRVVSSISGAPGGVAIRSKNVIGGIASVTELNVSGISTFSGISDFENDVRLKGDLFVDDDIFSDEIEARNIRVSGILTVSQALYYGQYSTYGIGYFNDDGVLTSTANPNESIDYSNFILTTDDTNIPSWTNAIDGGYY